MKSLLLTLALFASFVASAQNFAVWTHKAANTKAFRDGCPGEWPYVAQDIGEKTIPADLVARGWQQMTKAELAASIALLEQDKEAWNKAQEEAPRIAAEQAKVAADLAKAAKKAEADAVITEVEIGFKEWRVADEKAKGEILRKLLHVIIDALRSLGADVKQVEKPAADAKL